MRLLHRHVDPKSALHTDEANFYSRDTGFAEHKSVRHKGYEYARREGDKKLVTTNTMRCVLIFNAACMALPALRRKAS